MTTYTLQGTRARISPLGTPIDVTPVEIDFVVRDEVNAFSYSDPVTLVGLFSYLPGQIPAALFDVRLIPNEYSSGTSILDVPVLLFDFTWDGNRKSTELMLIVLEDEEIVVRLGGDPLPTFSNAFFYQLWVDSIDAVTTITTPGLAPDDAIRLNQLPGVSRTENDVVRGFAGLGYDFLDAGVGDDTIHGNDGDDDIIGGPGDDVAFGDAGDDQFFWEPGDGDDWLVGGLGEDRLVLTLDQSGDDEISLDVMDGRTIVSGGGSTPFRITASTIEATSIYAGNGNNTILTDSKVSDRLLIFSGIGDDTLQGGAGNDFISAIGGTNSIQARGGDDFLFDGVGDDVLNGGTGDDTITSIGGSDLIDGGPGVDTAIVSAPGGVTAVDVSQSGGLQGEIVVARTLDSGAIDTTRITNVEEVIPDFAENTGPITFTTATRLGLDITGTEFDDVFESSSGFLTVDAGAGDDTVNVVSGQASVDGGAGHDTVAVAFNDQIVEVQLELLNASDRSFEILAQLTSGQFERTFVSNSEAFDLSGATGPVNVAMAAGMKVDLELVASDQGERILSSSGDDSIDAGKGRDTILGRGGDDTLRGGGGNDRIFGHAGDDKAHGDGGNDDIDVGEGDDSANGGDGRDTILGGDGADSLSGGDGIDKVYGQNGSDWVDGGAGDDTVDGGAGDDLVKGGKGDDLVEGDDGDDTVYGDSGDDTLLGQAGNDTLRGGAGADMLDGGDGRDVASWLGLDSGIVLDFLTPANMSAEVAEDTFVNVEIFEGTGFNDSLRGAAQTDTFFGAGGNDTLAGRGSVDVLEGGDGNDVLLGGAGGDILTGGTGRDFLRGDAGIDRALYVDASAGVTVDLVNFAANTGEAFGDKLFLIENIDGSDHGDSLRGDAEANVLRGRDGDDALRGRGGDDTLDGGRGDDELLGGGGGDMFFFASRNGGVDTILDFEPGVDRLAFSSAAFGNLDLGALRPIHFDDVGNIGAHDRFIYDTATGELHYDANGGVAGERYLVAILTGAPALSASEIEIV